MRKLPNQIEKGGPGSGRKKTKFETKPALKIGSAITSELLDDIDDFKKKDMDLRAAALAGEATFDEHKGYRKGQLKEMANYIMSAPEPDFDRLKSEVQDIQKWASTERSSNMKNFSSSKKNAIDDQELKEIEAILRNAEKYIA